MQSENSRKAFTNTFLVIYEILESLENLNSRYQLSWVSSWAINHEQLFNHFGNMCAIFIRYELIHQYVKTRGLAAYWA